MDKEISDKLNYWDDLRILNGVFAKCFGPSAGTPLPAIRLADVYSSVRECESDLVKVNLDSWLRVNWPDIYDAWVKVL